VLMHKVSIKMDCPKCGFPASVSIKDDGREILLFVCPHCHSNVVYYNNKLDIISDHLLNKLIRKRKLKTCGMLEIKHPDDKKVEYQSISSDDIVDLKIALETSDSVESFIKKIS